MGKRTVFYQSLTGKSFKKHLQKDYADYRQWILTENKKSIQEFEEKLISHKIETFLRKNNTLNDFQNIGQEIIDELTIEYFLTYCDYGPGKDNFKIVGPMMGTWRYEKFKKQILKTDNSKLKTLCAILDNGKSLLNDKAFIPDTDNNKLGFWTISEQQELENILLEYKDAFDKTEGFKYLISLFEETKAKKQEIIIIIEK